jgi:diguanylate cyclase (GGDEF)-like protein
LLVPAVGVTERQTKLRDRFVADFGFEWLTPRDRLAVIEACAESIMTDSAAAIVAGDVNSHLQERARLHEVASGLSMIDNLTLSTGERVRVCTAPIAIDEKVAGTLCMVSPHEASLLQHLQLLAGFRQWAETEVRLHRLHQAHERCLEESHTDSLTGIWNRSAIVEMLRREVGHARRSGKSVAVALADLDHFKQINDRYGHSAGDEVLVEAARRLTARIRSYDAVGRYGGEEFLIVLPESEEESALEIADRVRRTFEETPFQVDGQSVRATISIGVATARNADPEQLVDLADEALYRAKNHGRNRVESWSE